MVEVAAKPGTQRQVDELKVPPHSIEAEQAVLGGLMLDNTAWDRVADRVAEVDFYRHDHRLIFRSIADLADKNRPFDVVTLSEWLEARGELDAAGGLPYLGNLAKDTPSAANITAYADIVRERSILRQLIAVGTDIAESGFQAQGRESKELLDAAEQKVFQIAERGARARQGFRPIKSLLKNTVEHIDMLFERDDPITGLPTGWNDFDEMTSGLQAGDLVIVAGRPSMGKCIVSGSRLPDPDTGELRTIDEMVGGRHGRLFTLGDDFRIRASEASCFVDDGIKPVFRVLTRSGREIRTTLMHPFLTDEGWRPLKEISIGDWVGVPRVIPVFGSDALPEHEVKLLAYFLADGGTTHTSPAFTNASERVREDFARAIAQFPNVQCELVESGGRTPTLRVVKDKKAVRAARAAFATRLNDMLDRLQMTGRALAQSLQVSPATVSYWRRAEALPRELHFRGLCDVLDVGETELVAQGRVTAAQSGPNAVAEWLERHGVLQKLAAEKRIPEAVFRLPRSQLALFLNRLFTCDGSAYVQNQTQAGLSYSTVSEGLAKDVRHLLLRFGVIAKLRRRTVNYQGGKRPTFELRILHQASILRFVDEIGVFDKEEAVARVKKMLCGRRAHSNIDSIPPSVWDYILRLKGTRTWPEIFESKGHSAPSNLHVGMRGLSRDRVKLFADLFDDAYLAHLAGSDVLWDPVEAIEFEGYNQVYDLSVPQTHNFVAEDVFVHNTSFAMNVAEYAAIKRQVPVAIFSMEMPGEQLAMRLLSSMGRINQQRLRTGKLEDEDWPRLTSAVSMFAEVPLFIDDGAALSPTEIRARARRLMREHGELGLIVVDYLQLMQVSGTSENRATEISEISRSLKALAKELRVPVVALSQLNRSLEQRPNKRPVMSDLRESGAIEQDADLIVFIYRDEVYNEESPDKGIAEIIVAKQRNGPIGTVRLTFLGQYTRFENFIPEIYSSEAYTS